MAFILLKTSLSSRYSEGTWTYLDTHPPLVEKSRCMEQRQEPKHTSTLQAGAEEQNSKKLPKGAGNPFNLI